MCSLLCLVMASVPLCYKCLFLYDNVFIHPKASIGVLEKGNLNMQSNPKQWTSVHWCFKKITAPKIFAYFAYFPAKHTLWRFFLSTLTDFPGIFPESFLEQLFCNEDVSTCFCKKELHSTCYLRNFPEL